jgi:hypothetical protein
MPDIIRPRWLPVSGILRQTGLDGIGSATVPGTVLTNMVVMSMEAYEQDRYESEVYLKLKEAEIEAESTTQRHNLEEVMDSMEKIITGAELDLKNRKNV